MNAKLLIDNICSQIAEKAIEYDLEQLFDQPTKGNNILDLIFFINFVSCDNVVGLSLFSTGNHRALCTDASVSACDFNGSEKSFDFNKIM